MVDALKIVIKRILHGEESVKTVGLSAFVTGKVPADGFMIQVSNSIQGSIFIRDSDLEKARALRKEKGKLVGIDAQSWGEDK